MKRSVQAVLLAGLLAGPLDACSNPPPINQANPCINGPPGDEPSACPSPPPGYTADVLPVLWAKCLVCHSPTEPDGGLNAQFARPYDYSTYSLQFSQKGTILTDILICKMPNIDAGAAPLDEAQRLTLMNWLVCGASNSG